jgi:hypothetical protein
MYLDNHLMRHLQQPQVDGIYKTSHDTKFTIVMPRSLDPSIADRAGIVEFMSDNPPMIQTTRADEALSNLEISGVNASVNIEVDKDAELSIVNHKAMAIF